MTQRIHPILEDGIDRKVLATLRARFLAVNAERFERALQGMSTRQQLVLRLLPLLFHVNHPSLPGYVSGLAPAGLPGYEPDSDTLAEAQRLTRSFSYKPLRAEQAQPIQGLFLMGSLGTIAQEERSDLDVWVCHDSLLSPEQLAALQRKCELLTEWADGQGSEAHFFLIDPVRFAQGIREARLTSDDCGTTQHYLLLDEFYRTAIWLGGRTPLWWMVPAYEEHRYADYAATLLARRFIRSEEVIDLGSLASIPPGEYLGAGLWQLFKAIGSPYKSLFKLLLLEAYASEHGQGRCLSLDFKQAVYHDRLTPDELDPYITAYRRIEGYLQGRGDHGRLGLLRHCLYLKVNKPLSQPPRNRQKSWQRLQLERITRDWGWDERQFALLDRRAQWKVGQVDWERRGLVNELTYGYRFLSDLARRLQASSSINRRDFAVIGRFLSAAIERKAGKVELINLGISPDMSEHNLTLMHAFDAAGEVSWALYPGSLSIPDVSNHAPLKRTRDLLPLLAWGHRNGIIDAATHLSLHSGDSGLDEGELHALLNALRQAFPMPPDEAGEEALLSASVPVQTLLLINVGLDPFSPTHLTPSDESADAFRYTAARENLVLSIDQLTLNSWSELIVSRHTGPSALANCLTSYLASLPAGSSASLQVRCFGHLAGSAIARRVEEIIEDMQRTLDDSDTSRYLLQTRQQFHVFELLPGQVRHTRLDDLGGLLGHLGEAHQRQRPLRIDRNVLAGQDLPEILRLGEPGCLQIFYRIDGSQAELSVLDEFNALWRQRVPYRDEQSLLTPLRRFLNSLNHRRNARLSLDESGMTALDVLFYRVLPGLGEHPPSIERRNPPRIEVNNPLYDVQAIIEPGEQKRSKVTLYCNHQEFSSLEYGSGLFAAVARYILAQRRLGERYPCYITDLDLSALHGTGRTQTVQYLRYKAQLEAALNQAVAAG